MYRYTWRRYPDIMAMTKKRAQEIASYWHYNEPCALYIFATEGRITPGLLEEIDDRLRFMAGTKGGRSLQALRRYVAARIKTA